jgi:transcriptional regulator with XRE-family HTH domain
MKDIKKPFGLRLKLLRAQAQMTQEQLAEQCNCSVVTLSTIENGKMGARFALISQLCQALNCTPRDLFDFDF